MYLKKRDQDSSDNLSGFDQDEMADHDEEEDDPSYFELAKMYQRYDKIVQGKELQFHKIDLVGMQVYFLTLPWQLRRALSVDVAHLPALFH